MKRPEFAILRISEKLNATYGVLMEDGHPLMLTLEDPWLQNQPNISCIPPGPYSCKRVNSPKHGDTFRVQNVVGRTYINFHSGNDEEDTEGCILLGSEWGKDNLGEAIILESKKAVSKFMERLKGINAFTLYIRKP